MADQALYRKYRSGNFTEVIGQDHVVKTLTSAINSGHLSHAYLFTGPRGVGKTSVARLLARALNCTSDSKPCNACPNCLAAINSSLDVIEIDAASNRSIDAVRDLREKIGLAPTQGTYKIYIIDEVHMLTTEAFNALLKTLEEPPAHAVFILATTEAHKLPETIISRTQRFNFKPITDSDITSHLAKIATAEGIKIEPAALSVIATAARGGFRDAISMLDQLASGSTGTITDTTVRELLGYSSAEEIAALATAMSVHDTKTALEILERLEQQGSQPGQVAIQLTNLWRSVLLAGARAKAAEDPILEPLTNTTPPAAAARIVETLLEITRSHWPQLALEAAVVKLTANEPESATKRIESLAPRTQATPAAARTVNTDAASSLGAKAQAPKVPTKIQAENSTVEVTTEEGKLKAELWPKVLVILKSQNNSLCALLQMYPVDFADGEVTIKPRFNFHRDLFMKPVNRIMIEAAAAKVYGRTVKVGAKTEDSGKPVRKAKTDSSAELVSSALEILGGEVVE